MQALLKENDVIATRYRVVREIGRGGMGVVWEAEDTQLPRRVAVKVIINKLARDKKKLERFEMGAKAVAGLDSPHIVKLLEYGVDGSPYMVMELLEGTVLTERIAGGKRFALDAAARIVVQTAKALAVAHEAGVVHRNLKPGNIFLVDQGGDFVKVFDFGTAKWLTGFRNANDITTMGSIMGNPDYLAPEQLSGDARSDLRADVWSLGAIAYHLVTGVTPFEGEQMGAIMRSILFSEPEPPSSIDPSLPAELDQVFRKALAKKRDERFQSAHELAEALCDAMGVSVAQMAISVRAAPSEPPDIGDLDSSELPETRFEGRTTPAPVSELGDPPAPAAAAGEPPASGPRDSAALVDTPARAALVRPALSRSPRLDLPSTPVLVAGAAAFLAVGGLAAWLVMAPAADGPTPASASSADVTESAPPPATDPPAAPSPSASAAAPAPSPAPPPVEPSAVPSTEPALNPPPVHPRRWRDPDDIYDGL